MVKANPFFSTLSQVLAEGAMTRPSTAAGARYDAISEAYFTAVRQTFTGQKSSAAAVEEIEKELQQIMSK